MTGELGLLAAFAAGVLSFLSPCVLPLVPGYISFISGVNLEDAAERRWQALAKATLASLFFGAGFTVIFVLLGATATALGQLLFAELPLIQTVGGIVIVVFGIHTMRLLPIPFLYREVRFFPAGTRGSLPGGFLLGMAFAIGWTPCIGPILAGILAYASTQQTTTQGLILLGAYSFGLGMPFLALAVAMTASEKIVSRVRKHTRAIELISGTLLIALGILVSTGNLSELSSYLASLAS